jgi:nitroreductase
MKAIYARRSIRRYAKDPLPREKLLEFVKAGMNAPSAGNEQPWQFLVVTDRPLLGKIMEIHPYSSMLREAPAAIMVCGDTSLEKYKGYWVQDCSAATENILLEIADQGYGGVWLGVYPVEDRVKKLQKLFALPAHVIPLSLIAVGVPAETKEPKDVFLVDRVKFDRWS